MIMFSWFWETLVEFGLCKVETFSVVEKNRFFLLLVFQDGQIHANSISFEVLTRHHRLEINPFRVDEGVLDLIPEDDGVELVKQNCDLFIHNDQIFISYY